MQGVSSPPTSTKYKFVSFTRDMSLAAGDQVVAGVGFKPKAIIFFSAAAAKVGAASWGVADETLNLSVSGMQDTSDTLANTYALPEHPIIVTDTGAGTYRGKISALGNDGFTITWARAGVPTATLIVLALCLG